MSKEKQKNVFGETLEPCSNEPLTGWLGDGYCDDGTWGMVFLCDEYGNDCGDCGEDNDPLGVCK